MPTPVIKGKVAAYCRIANGFAKIASVELAALDENETGGDDYAAAVIDYSTAVLDSLLTGNPVPLPPAAVTKGPRADVKA